MSWETVRLITDYCVNDPELTAIACACECVDGKLDLSFKDSSQEFMTYLNADKTRRITAKTSTALKKACEKACSMCRAKLNTNPNLSADIGRLSQRMKHGSPEAGWTLKILRGDDITYAYEAMDGSSHSCMTGGSAYKTGLYALNPDKVGLAMIESKGRLIARCIVWDGVECGKGTFKAYDRIYNQSGIRGEDIKAELAKADYTCSVYPGQDRIMACGRVTLSAAGLLCGSLYTPYLDAFDTGILDISSETLCISNEGFNEEELGRDRYLLDLSTTRGFPDYLENISCSTCDCCGTEGDFEWRIGGDERGFRCVKCWEEAGYEYCDDCAVLPQL